MQRLFIYVLLFLAQMSPMAWAQNMSELEVSQATQIQQERLLQQLGAAMDIMQGKKDLQNVKNVFGEVTFEYTGSNNWQTTFNDNTTAFRMIGNTNEVANKISSNVSNLHYFPIEQFEQRFHLKRESSSNNIEHFGNVDGSFFTQVYRYHYRIKYHHNQQDRLLLINFTYSPYIMGKVDPLLRLDAVSLYSIPLNNNAPDDALITAQ